MVTVEEAMGSGEVFALHSLVIFINLSFFFSMSLPRSSYYSKYFGRGGVGGIEILDDLQEKK